MGRWAGSMEGLWRVDYPQIDLLAMAVAVYRYKDEGGIAVTTCVSVG